MAAQIQPEQDIQPVHPMTGLQQHFTTLMDSLKTIPDKTARRNARTALSMMREEMIGLMDHAQREIQNGDALIEAALAAATVLSQQRTEAVGEIERLQREAYEDAMQGIATAVGASMGIDREAVMLLFDSLVGDADFPAVHGVEPEQVQAFRGAMVAMLRAMRGGGE